MSTLGPSGRFYVYREPADVRKGCDGLWGIFNRELHTYGIV